ncbi:hypothetical protein MBLNU230_g1860t1 [Neophaeotheca triangularis]
MFRTRTFLPQPDDLSAEALRKKARWIRDVLDPRIAQNGAEALKADEILTLDEFLRKLLTTTINVDDLRYSRMHLAVSDIAGCATRWPSRLIARCNALIDAWEGQFGPLKAMGTPLYEPGGRLHGICKPTDLSRERLLVNWLKNANDKLSPSTARKVGALGFRPGDWWIHPMFAFRDGIIDCGDPKGEITADSQGAYAVVLTDHDEIGQDNKPSAPELFTYRARHNDKGRYRLTAGNVESRQPVRILRNHTLRSFWSPSAGIRYDGLYKVISWRIKFEPTTKTMSYDITFQRLPMQASMEAVLARPMTEEAEDYREYKRIRKQMQGDLTPKLPSSANALLSMDGENDIQNASAADLVAVDSGVDIFHLSEEG